MALKDWNKKTSGRILTQFENRKNGKIIDIIKMTRLRGMYSVELIESDGIRRTTTPHTKLFATKLKALKYAKVLMRKH